MVLLTPTFSGAPKCKDCRLFLGCDSFVLLDTPGTKTYEIMLHRSITDQKTSFLASAEILFGCFSIIISK